MTRLPAQLITRPIVAKSANFTVGLADRETMFSITGSITVSLPAVATAGAKFGFWASNDGTGIVMIDPNGAETINRGYTTEYLFPGESAYFYTDGTVWVTSGLNWADWRCVEFNTPLSDVASWSRVGLSMFSSLKLNGFLRPVVNNSLLYTRYSTDNGASYLAGASDYQHQIMYAVGASAAGSTATAAYGFTAGNVSSDTDYGGVTINEMVIENFNKTRRCDTIVDVGYQDGSSGPLRMSVWHEQVGTIARNAIQLLFSSNNIAEGRISLWGMRG